MTHGQKFTIELQGKSLQCTFGNGAMFRAGSLERPFELAELSDTKRSYAALCAWTWACLDAPHRQDYPSPESLAEVLGMAEVRAVAKAFGEAVSTSALAQQPGDAKKKSHGSKPAPGRASSSG